MGIFIYYFFPVRKSVMSKNIDIVYKDTISTAEKKRLMIAFYAHTATSIKEMIMLMLLGSKLFEKKIKLVGVEHYTAAAAHNKGVLLLTGHLGNWEFSCSIAVAEFQKILGQFKFCVIRRTIKTKWIDKIIRNHCEACHVSVIKSRGARQKVPQALKEGYGVCFAIDQHASLKPHVGVPVNFFGRKAGTYMGLAENVQHNQTPVVP